MNNSNGMRERSEYSVQAVTNAIRVLEALGDAEHEQSLPELCAKLSLTKSNANKLLSTLERFGYVDANAYTANLRLGVKTFQIAQAYINKLNLSEIALPLQRSLRDEVNESVYISVLRRANVVYLSVVETDAPVRVMPRIGNVGPAYATATGKVQLAFMDEKEVENLYEGAKFTQYTDKTVKSITELLQDLEQIRKCGYALDNEEYELGVRCVATPVRNFMGNVIAGMSISAPIERMGDEIVQSELLPQLTSAAYTLSTKFGFRQ
jgi:DNA-binding IclR family transcriptional regulator